MPMAVGDLMEVKFYCLQAEQVGINVRHYAVTAMAGAGLTELQLAIGFATLLAPKYKQLIAEGARFEGVGVRKIRPLPVSMEAFSANGSGPGTVTGDTLPRQVTGLLSLRTNEAGPRRRGRVYVPFPGEFHNAANAIPSAAYTNLLSELGDALKANASITSGANTADLRPVIWSRVGGTSADLTVVLARQKWATQRRRGSYGRPNAIPEEV